MSKAILVLDEMPKSCMECEIFDNEQLLCLGGKVHFKDIDKVQSWCPLKPLKENYISVDWLKQNIPFQNEEDKNILLSMLDVWRNKDE